MASNTPVICIGMPVYNCETFIAQSIASIINQTYEKWILKVIDDASSDATAEIIESFDDSRIRLRRGNRRRGLAVRLNEILEATECMYFARMDGDDIAFPTRLESQLRYIENNPEVDLVGAGVLIIGSDGHVSGKRLYPESHEDISSKFYLGFAIVHPTFFARSVWMKKFMYNAAFKKSQDYELLSRAYSSSRFANIQEALLAYRIAPMPMSKIVQSRVNSIRIILAGHRKTIGFRGVIPSIAAHLVKMVVSIVLTILGRNLHSYVYLDNIGDNEKRDWALLQKDLQMIIDNSIQSTNSETV